MVPVVSIVGRKNSGKTTLIEGIVPELKRRGYRIGIIKHQSHRVDIEDIDSEGKDTYRHQLCGAEVVVLAGQDKLMFVKTLKDPLAIDEIRKIYLNGLDMVITEGYRAEDKPKIEVFREEVGKEEGLLCTQEKDNLIAVVSNCKFNVALPCFSLNDYSKIADFLEKEFISNKQPSKINLLIDQKEIRLNKFASEFLKRTILGMISSLRNVPENPAEVEIKIKE